MLQVLDKLRTVSASDVLVAKVNGDEAAELIDFIDYCIEIITDEVAQSCTVNGKLDSCGISARAHSMRMLASLGKLTVTMDRGRRVIGHWNTEVITSEDKDSGGTHD